MMAAESRAASAQPATVLVPLTPAAARTFRALRAAAERSRRDLDVFTAGVLAGAGKEGQVRDITEQDELVVLCGRD
jgi:hypothetical protein